MSSFQPSLALALAFLLNACAKSSDRPIETASSSPVSQAAKSVPARAQLMAACRDTAARANASVRWVSDTSVTADLTYDASPELIVWGTEGDSLFVLAIVECSGSRPGRVWTFPMNALKAFGTTDLNVALIDPAPGQGYLDENCIRTDTTAECRHLRKIEPELEAAYSRGGRGLSIGIEDRDHVYIYWDPEFSRFVSWRP
jgi:hypothetical protein